MKIHSIKPAPHHKFQCINTRCFTKHITHPKYSADFAISASTARSLSRGRFAPFKFEMENAPIRRKYLPFYAITGSVKLSISAEIGFSSRMNMGNVIASEEIIERTDKGLWTKLSNVNLVVNAASELDTFGSNPGDLNLNRSDIVFAGPDHYGEIIRNFAHKKIFGAISSMDAEAMEENKWRSYGNSNLFYNVPLEPFSMSSQDAIQRFLDDLQKINDESNAPPNSNGKSSALTIASSANIRLSLMNSYLCNDVRNIKIEALETQKLEAIPFAVPMYSIENIWNDTIVDTLVNALHGQLYGVSLWSPLKSSLFIGLLVVNLQKLGISSSTIPELECVMGSLSAAILSWFYPQLKLLEVEKRRVGYLNRKALEEAATESSQSQQRNDSTDSSHYNAREQPPYKHENEDTEKEYQFKENNSAWLKKRFLRRRKLIGRKSQQHLQSDEELYHSDPLGLYARLGLLGNETQEEISSAYYRMAKLFHPDLQQGDQEKEFAKIKFQQILEAYNVLKDEEKRASYNGSNLGNNS